MTHSLRIPFLFLLIIFTPLVFYAQWDLVPSNTSSQLNEVHFPSDSIGYIVGENGTVLKSVDQGNSWTSLVFDSLVDLNVVHFINKDTGYVGADGLFRTYNGGIDWNTLLPDSIPIYEVYFPNDSIGYLGSFQSVYRTEDYGMNWLEVFRAEGRQNGFNAIHFPTEETGYFIGGTSANETFFRTTDNGRTFQEVTNGFISIKESVFFLNPDTGYMCGWYNGLIVRTEDGGQSWYYPANEWVHQCKDIYFLNENEGYYIDNSGGRYGIYYTSDNAKSWQQQLELVDGYLNAFAFIDDQTGIAVGAEGIIYHTSNGGFVSTDDKGKNWDFTVFPNPARDRIFIKVPQYDFKSMYLDIISSTGLIHHSTPISGNSSTIGLNDLASGIYILLLRKGQRILGRQKLIVQ